MLIDDISITIQAGKGGNGKVSFHRNAQTSKGGPNGGNGGTGGNVYIQGINDITGLEQFRYKKILKAEDGVDGGKNNLFGRRGEDLIIHLPIGTTITDEYNNALEITNTTTKILWARGGKGGRGNNEFKTATNQTPLFAEKGEKGEGKKVNLSLRLIADIGLIGLPNAGKSSLLKSLTNAKPRIDSYPFTTLEPNLGVMISNQNIILADIPGLIKGASQGKGLGITFLKHIEKTKLLLHCIDSSSSDLLKDYKIVREEFEKYNLELIQKQTCIVLTKIDLLSAKELEKKKSRFEKMNLLVLCVSIYDADSLEGLKKTIMQS